jgi:hypothetical protein
MSKPETPSDETPDNIIEIKDDDGNVVHTIDVDLCDHIADSVLTNLSNMEDEVEDFDFVTAVFSLFVNSIHILADAGWTEQDLIKEVQAHAHEHVPANQLN